MRPFLVFGTRPEAIKMAPLVRACREHSHIDPFVCVTGQHREMLRQVIDYFQLKVDVDLELMTTNQTLASLTSQCLTRLDEWLGRVSPDCVVAQGDTTTVMAAAMAAFYRRIPFVHVEAGLRTGDVYSPYPEEFNRRVAGLVTQLHCAPTQESANNLLREGISADQVHVTGNTVIDALLWVLQQETTPESRWQEKYPYLSERMVLITGHRRENFGLGFQHVCQAIADLSARFPETSFVYPVHLNPNVQEPVHRLLGNRPNIFLVPPVPYPEFVWLMHRSHIILTDSGGIQEEAPSLRKPVVVMRETTERPEAVAAGAAILTGTDSAKIVETVSLLLTSDQAYTQRIVPVNPYGDGAAAQRIAHLLVQCFSNSK